MTDVELAAFEADIVAICAEHWQSHWQDDDYRVCVPIESKESKYFIKFDDPRTLGPEFSTQSYIHNYAMRHGNGPRIHQALRYFEIKEKAFFLMEHIALTHPSLTTDLAERTARALEWLSKVSAPPGDIMGEASLELGYGLSETDYNHQ
jgi:hypothetical protein